MKAALPLHLYTEKDWDRQLKQLCDQLGWTLNYQTLGENSIRDLRAAQTAPAELAA